jgi:hypothetical protein
MLRLKDPICDLRFLLNRGYNRATAVRTVANRYRLPKADRHILMRAVFSENEAEEHRMKRVDIADINGRKVTVDGYNVLITVESGLKGKELFLSDDGFVRDVAATFGKYRFSNVSEKAIELILKGLERNSPSEVNFIFDSQVSFSGELCRLIRAKMSEIGLKGNAKTSDNADYEIILSRGIVCSSDTAIIKKADKLLDLPRHLGVKYQRLPSCEDILGS